VGAGGLLTATSAPCGTNASDRNLKANFASVNAHSVLDRVAALPILTWNYLSQPRFIRHMRPMAQDFRKAFRLGEDDKHIATIDSEGVALALAAIRELYPCCSRGTPGSRSKVSRSGS
jgi:hypothetical protein